MRKARTILKPNATDVNESNRPLEFSYRSRTHLAHREPPYVRETVFNRLVIVIRSFGRDALI